MRTLSMETLGRVIIGLALAGYGVENFLFRYYVVARAVPWPAEPSTRFVVAGATGAVFILSGFAFLAGKALRPAGVASAALMLGWMLVRHLPVAITGPAWSGDWTNVLKAATLPPARWPCRERRPRLRTVLGALGGRALRCRRVLPARRHSAPIRGVRRDVDPPFIRERCSDLRGRCRADRVRRWF